LTTAPCFGLIMPQEPAVAVQLIKYNAVARKFEVHTPDLHHMLAPFSDCELTTISIVGPCQEGKSFLMNWLSAAATAERTANKFLSGDGQRSYTQGVWLYVADIDESAGVKCAPTRQRRVHAFLDVEGNTDTDPVRDPTYNGKLMGIVMMLSSALIFHARTTVRAEHVTMLQVVDGVIRHITRELAKDIEDLGQLRGPAPVLHFVVRDAMLQDATRGGDARVVSPDEWLESMLASGSGATEQARTDLIAQFTERHLHRLPMPFDEPTAENRIALQTQPKSAWPSQFREAFVLAHESIVASAPRLTVTGAGGMQNTPLLAGQFPALVHSVVDCVNSSEATFSSPVELMVKQAWIDAERAFTDAYDASVSTKRLPLPTAAFDAAHSEAHDAGREAFKTFAAALLLAHAPKDVAARVAEISSKCKAGLLQRNKDSSLPVCQAAAADAKRKFEAALPSMMRAGGAEEFQRVGAQLRDDFLAAAKDCDAEVIELAYQPVFDYAMAQLPVVAAHDRDLTEAAQREVLAQSNALQREQEAHRRMLAAQNALANEQRQQALQLRVLTELVQAQNDQMAQQLAATMKQQHDLLLAMQDESKQRSAEMTQVLTAVMEQQTSMIAEIKKTMKDNQDSTDRQLADHKTATDAAATSQNALLQTIANRPAPSKLPDCFSADSTVVVKGKPGTTAICNVVAGDRVLSWDPRTKRARFTEVYFAAVHTHTQTLIRIDTATPGASVTMTPLHQAMVVADNTAPPRFVNAASVRPGDLIVTVVNGVVAHEQVTAVRVEALAAKIACALTLDGMVVIDGVVCSCYDGGHHLGFIENLDLRALYHLCGSRIANSAVVARYAEFCDREVHRRVRQGCDYIASWPKFSIALAALAGIERRARVVLYPAVTSI
jgi:hypothetical protein